MRIALIRVNKKLKERRKKNR